jgi:HK97 family phage portal protein
MPSLQAAFKAAALHRAQQRAQATAAKSIVRGGPLLQRSLVGRPLANREWLLEHAVDRYFKLSGLVYRAAVSLATAVGSVRWQVEVRTKDRWEVAEGEELQALLDKPHPFFNRQAFNELMVLYLALGGNALAQKTLASGKPASGAKAGRVLELVPLVSDGIQPVPDDVEWVSRYEFKGPPRKTWLPSELLHILLPDPSNPYWGMSPFFAVRNVIQTDLAAIKWNQSSMANRAISDGVFSAKATLTTVQYEELKDQIWEQHQGVERAHEPWVLGGDTQWLAMERTPVEMDFNESRMRNREDVLSAGGVPPVEAGYFENATLANADVSRRIFWEDTTVPVYVERIAGCFNSSLVPHFGDPAKLRVSYDISGIPALRDDLVKKAAALNVLVRCGTPYNDALDELELDLPKIPGIGEVPYGLESLKPQQFAPGAPDAGDLPPGPKARRPVETKRARKTEIRTGVFATSIADSEAPAIRRAFLAELAKLRAGASLDELLAIIQANDAGAAIAKLGGNVLPQRLLDTVGKLIERTAMRGAELAAERLAAEASVDLAVDGSRLARWLKPYLHERTAQLTNTTEAAAREFFADLGAGKLGDDPRAAAQLLRDTWGLHRQQAAGVRNVYGALLGRGQTPEQAAETAGKLARARLLERAQTVGEHESLVAANRGNGMLWEQAVQDGSVATASATWYTEEDGDVDDECVSLADQEIDLAAGQRFAGASGHTYREPPEPHPGCRCGLLYSAVS